MDEIAKKLNVEYPSDWGKTGVRRVLEFKGGSSILRYYNNCMFDCLQDTYKGFLFFD